MSQIRDGYNSTSEKNLVRPLRLVDTSLTFDTNPAVFTTAPTPAAPAKFTIDVTFALDKKAWGYAVALEAGSPAPSAAQIRDGKDASGIELDWDCRYSGETQGSVTETCSFREDNYSVPFNPEPYDLYFVTETYGLLSTPVKITATTRALRLPPSMYVRGHLYRRNTAKSMTLVDNLWALDVDEAQIKLGSTF